VFASDGKQDSALATPVPSAGILFWSVTSIICSQ